MEPEPIVFVHSEALPLPMPGLKTPVGGCVVPLGMFSAWKSEPTMVPKATPHDGYHHHAKKQHHRQRREKSLHVVLLLRLVLARNPETPSSASTGRGVALFLSIPPASFTARNDNRSHMIDDPAFFHAAHAIVLSGPCTLYACACGQLVCDHLCRPTRGGSAWLTVPLGAFGLARGVMAFCKAA